MDIRRRINELLDKISLRVYNRIRGKDGDADGHTQANQ